MKAELLILRFHIKKIQKNNFRFEKITKKMALYIKRLMEQI